MFLKRLITFFCALLFTSHLCMAQVPQVLVSVAPTKCLIDRISGGTVSTSILVPPGASPHSYEPSIKKMAGVTESVVWFRIGESFEKKLCDAFDSQMKIVDLRDGLSLLDSSQCLHSHEKFDPHIWLSPKLLMTQAKHIAEELASLFPDNKESYEKNLNDLLEELQQIDLLTSSLFSEKGIKAILVLHPAFGYFCKDYGIEQISIQKEGKEPTFKQIETLLEQAKKQKISKVFVQPQYNPKGAYAIAKRLNASVVEIDPYSEDVLKNLLHIAKSFTK